MRIISTSYSKSPEFNNPQDWLKRISFYTGLLEQLAIQNEVISIERIDYEGVYTQNGVYYHFVRQKRKVAFFPNRAHYLIRKTKPDIVMVNGFIFPLQIIQLRLYLGKAVKIIILHRAEKPFTGWKKYLQKLADKCVDAYFFASAEFGKEWMQKGIIQGEKKVYEVIQSSSSFYPKEKGKARAELFITGTPVFLWVGRLDSNKDPVTVVKAFIQFLTFEPAARLYMIYQADELLNEIKILINKGDKPIEAIRLLGSIPHEGLQTWYSSADFIISGSHYEGSGIAISEAMSCGCIPVVTNIISFRRMTGPGKCGLLYEASDDKGLLAALLQTRQMDMEKERHRVLQQFNNELSFKAIAEKIEKIILSL